MNRLVGVTVLAVMVLSGCAKSRTAIYAKVRDNLSKAESIYSTLGNAASSDGQRQVDSSKEKPNDQTSMRLFLAAALSTDVTTCKEAKMVLQNLEAQEQMKEAPSIEIYEKLLHHCDELSKDATNFATNPKITDVLQPVERLELGKARQCINEAEELVLSAKPGQ